MSKRDNNPCPDVWERAGAVLGQAVWRAWLFRPPFQLHLLPLSRFCPFLTSCYPHNLRKQRHCGCFGVSVYMEEPIGEDALSRHTGTPSRPHQLRFSPRRLFSLSLSLSTRFAIYIWNCFFFRARACLFFAVRALRGPCVFLALVWCVLVWRVSCCASASPRVPRTLRTAWGGGSLGALASSEHWPSSSSCSSSALLLLRHPLPPPPPPPPPLPSFFARRLPPHYRGWSRRRCDSKTARGARELEHLRWQSSLRLMDVQGQVGEGEKLKINLAANQGEF